MNNVRIAKQLIKIAKNLVAGQDNDAQIQLKFEEAEAKGKKYILHHQEGKLWRIMACKDFADVKKGDFGGLIESEDNLSHVGKCWVYDKAIVRDEANVFDDAQIYNRAFVSEQAKVYGGAKVFEDAIVHGLARVRDEANVYGHAEVCGTSVVSEKASVYGYAFVDGDSWIHGKSGVDWDVRGNNVFIK